MNLYGPKAATSARLAFLVHALADGGVAADTITLLAIPVAVAAGVCLLASPAMPVLLLVVPILAGARLSLNLLDGALARETGRIHPRGELLNELGDRVADVAFLAPVAALPGASASIVLLGVIAALLASYVGITSKAAGGQRGYRGVLSKPGRMVLLSVASIGAFVVGAGAWTAFGPVLLVGALLTLAERIYVAMRSLA